MINSRASYDFVTFPDGVIVNGGIMPLRSGSEANALRLEDVGFLCEAMCERQAAMGETANHETLTKEIRAYPLSTVANGLTTLAPKFFPDFTPTKKKVSGLTGNTIASVYNVASTSPTASFATGGQLVAANVKNLFDAVKTMRQFEAEGEVTIEQTGVEHTYTYGPDERFNRQSDFSLPRTGLRAYATNAWTATWSNVGGVVREEADGGYEYEIYATSGTYKVAVDIGKKYVDSVSVVAIMGVATGVTIMGESAITWTSYCYAIPVEATYADGSISVDFSAMSSASDKLISDMGLLRPGYTARQYSYYYWSTRVHDLLAICKLGDHTSF